MPETIAVPDQEDQTERYLRTNGPPPGAFEPDVPHYALNGASDRETYLLEMASKADKQNRWLINEVIGLKGAHRIIHTRLEEGDKKFDQFEALAKWATEWRDKWLTRQKMIRNVIIGLFTLFLLPFLSLFMVEVMKRILHWP